MKRPTVANNRGRIIIRATVGGARHEIQGFGRYDDPTAQKEAKLVADRLYADMLSDRLLPDIQQYSPRFAVARAEVATKQKTLPLLSKLWERFVSYKAESLCENSLRRYATTGAAIGALKLDAMQWNVLEIREALSALLPDNRLRVAKHLVALSAWAYDHDLLPLHHLVKLKTGLAIAKALPVPKPFTVAQRDALLAYMQQHKDYSYYYPLVLFMFHTGCRPCEAVGLQWQDVDLERQQVTLGRSVVYLGNGTTQARPMSKTGRTRIFPFNKALKQLFDGKNIIKNSALDSPIFISKSGNYIKFDNFRRRCWKNCVEAIGLKCDVVTPYSARDTFITLALDKGIAVRDISKLCDNSPTIIYRHYAGWVREIAPVDT